MIINSFPMGGGAIKCASGTTSGNNGATVSGLGFQPDIVLIRYGDYPASNPFSAASGAKAGNTSPFGAFDAPTNITNEHFKALIVTSITATGFTWTQSNITGISGVVTWYALKF